MTEPFERQLRYRWMQDNQADEFKGSSAVLLRITDMWGKHLHLSSLIWVYSFTTPIIHFFNAQKMLTECL